MEMTSKAKVVVLFANAYELENEQREKIKGCTIHYLFWGENGEAIAEQSEWDVTKPVGVQRAKVSLDYDVRRKIPIAPALYEADFRMTVGADGQPVLRMQDIAYVSNLDIKAKVVPGIVVPGMVEEVAKK